MVSVFIRAAEEDPSTFIEEKLADPVTAGDVAAVAKEKMECFKDSSINGLKVYLESGTEFCNEMKLEDGQNLYVTNIKKDEADNIVRLCILGSGAVGKSALTMRYTVDLFQDFYDPTIEDAYRKQTEIDGKQVTIDILDTAGQEDYISLRSAWYRSKDGFLLVFALNNENSLMELKKFRDEITDHYSDRRKVPPMLLVGNKADLAQVPTLWEKANEKVEEWGMIGSIKTSAKTNVNVHAAFANTVRGIRRSRKAEVKPRKRRKLCLIL